MVFGSAYHFFRAVFRVPKHGVICWQRMLVKWCFPLHHYTVRSYPYNMYTPVYTDIPIRFQLPSLAGWEILKPNEYIHTYTSILDITIWYIHIFWNIHTFSFFLGNINELGDFLSPSHLWQCSAMETIALSSSNYISMVYIEGQNLILFWVNLGTYHILMLTYDYQILVIPLNGFSMFAKFGDGIIIVPICSMVLYDQHLPNITQFWKETI